MKDRDLKNALNTFNGVVNADEVEPLEIPPDAQANRDEKQTTWDDDEDLTKTVMKRNYASDDIKPMPWPGSQPCQECED